MSIYTYIVNYTELRGNMISFLKRIKETTSFEDINNHDKAVLITSLMIEYITKMSMVSTLQ